MSGTEPGHELVFSGREFCSVGDCIEVARLPDGRVALRSSLASEAPSYIVGAGEWEQFLHTVKAGRFDDL